MLDESVQAIRDAEPNEDANRSRWPDSQRWVAGVAIENLLALASERGKLIAAQIAAQSERYEVRLRESADRYEVLL